MSKKKYRGELWEFIPADSEDVKKAVESLEPKDQRVKVSLAKRAKGKLVSLAEGFVLAPHDLKSLCKKLKQECGTGGTSKDSSIELQGDHVVNMRQALIREGYRVT